jgi:hypothetical protein
MADKMTITEALAEIKTIGKRIEKKQEFVMSNLLRQEQYKDPLAAEGGQVAAVASERQAIKDLQERVVRIRRAIDEANAATTVTVGESANTIADWLVWKREVAPVKERLLGKMVDHIARIRAEATKKGLAVAQPGESTRPQDVVVNLNEKALADEIEGLQNTLGTLDGQLSLKNATVLVTI